eukprot:366167-Chlamydomonas_euryale.AAC.14
MQPRGIVVAGNVPLTIGERRTAREQAPRRVLTVPVARTADQATVRSHRVCRRAGPCHCTHRASLRQHVSAYLYHFIAASSSQNTACR